MQRYDETSDFNFYATPRFVVGPHVHRNSQIRSTSLYQRQRHPTISCVYLLITNAKPKATHYG
jgi:hypothetical protein